MTIKESVEKLGKKLTGKDIHGASISDVVSKVGDNFEGGSGGVVFEIVAERSGTIVSAEKTPDEVEQLLYKGTYVCCKLSVGGESMLLPMEMINVTHAPEEAVVVGTHPCGYYTEADFGEGFEIERIPMLLTAPNNTWMLAGL